MIVKGKKYYYKNFRMEKSTAKKLNALKKKAGLKWDFIFREFIKLYNDKHVK